MMVGDLITITCVDCQVQFPWPDYGAGRRRKMCDDCKTARKRARENAPKAKARRKAWRAANKAWIAERERKRRHAWTPEQREAYNAKRRGSEAYKRAHAKRTARLAVDPVYKELRRLHRKASETAKDLGLTTGQLYQQWRQELGL